MEEESDVMKKFVDACNIISLPTLEERKLERWKMTEGWRNPGDILFKSAGVCRT